MLTRTVWNRLFIYLKMDLALNNLQRFICRKTQTNKQTDRVLSMGQIEKTVGKQMTDIKLWQLYGNTI